MTDCQTTLFTGPVRVAPLDERGQWVSMPARHGRVDWHEITPLEAIVMLAAMIDQSASSRHPRCATYLGIVDEVRRRFDPGKRWDGETIGDAIYSLRDRGALAIRPGAVDVLAWPVPGGAPW